MPIFDPFQKATDNSPTSIWMTFIPEAMLPFSLFFIVLTTMNDMQWAVELRCLGKR